MKLTADQEEIIVKLVEQNNFTIVTLKDDVVDHLCCVIESRISQGIPFQDALNEAVNELAPRGLYTLEEETFYLFNSTKIRNMKKLMFAVGLLSAMAVAIGWTFTTLHWSFGGQLATFGIIAFIFLFLPMLFINNYKFALKQQLSDRLRIILGFGSAFVLGLAIVFKILHLQGADLLLLSGGVLLSFGFLPFLFFRMYKKSVARN